MSRHYRIRADQFGLLSHANVKQDGAYVEGEIIKYTNIDLNGDWFSLESGDVASDEDKSNINIPAHLKPNMNRFSFIFFPDVHLLIYEAKYEGKNLTPNSAVTFFKKIFSAEEIISKYGEVNVVHHTEPNELKDFLSLQGITKIHMLTHRPNPDGLKSAESKLKERLKRLNASKEEKTIISVDNSGLNLDDETKIEAKVAAKNGFVKIKRKNEKGRVENFSTEEHPLIRQDYYRDGEENPFDMLVRFAYRVKRDLSEWLS
ncbi:DUF4747 family protein [Oceanimonas smirnovii]|uniref:DUF4747 family protein n=1 Tax=Oceanimonas smirnovii TaxID=264574 RepID=UPI003FD108BF